MKATEMVGGLIVLGGDETFESMVTSVGAITKGDVAWGLDVDGSKQPLLVCLAGKKPTAEAREVCHKGSGLATGDQHRSDKVP